MDYFKDKTMLLLIYCFIISCNLSSQSEGLNIMPHNLHWVKHWYYGLNLHHNVCHRPPWWLTGECEPVDFGLLRWTTQNRPLPFKNFKSNKKNTMNWMKNYDELK